MYLQEMVVMVLRRYGICAIDIFTKMVSVIPMKNRSPSEIIRGLKLIFEELGKPKQLYSDEESSLRSQDFFRFIHESNIKTIQTSTHAHTIERFIYTFRMNLQRRLDALDQEKSEWVKRVDNITKKYNNTEHVTIQIKPVEAVKSENILWVNWHLQNNTNKYRKYPKIAEGDMVRIMIKRNKFDKTHMSNWSSEKYKVLGIDKTNVMLNHHTKRTVFMRHEIRK